MKYSIKSIYDKFTAMIILISMTVIAAGCVLGIYYLQTYNFYKDGGESARQKTWFTNMKESEADIEHFFYSVYNITDKIKNSDKNDDSYKVYETIADSYEKKYSKEKSNVFFNVCDSSGTVLFSNYDDKDPQFEYEQFYSINGETYTITCCLRNENNLEANDIYRLTDHFIRLGNALKYVVIFVLVVTVIVLLVMMSLLAYGAGDVNEEGQISLSFIDKIPFDILSLGFIGTLAASWLSIRLTQIADSNIVLLNVVVFFVIIIMVMIFLLYLSTFSVRIKMGNLFENTILYRLYSLITKNMKRYKRLNRFKKSKGVKKSKKRRSSYYRNLIIATSILFLIEIIVIALFYFKGWEFSDYVYYWTVSRVVAIPIIVIIALNLAYTYDVSKRLAEGDIDEPEDATFMFKGFRMYNKNLERIRKEIAKSVEAEMKSEKLKNELITNLSHDIKTPLTSIISYVSLLKENDNFPEDEKEYIEVIDRQSQKLKKLLENLIESSKLSKGEITAEKESMNVGLIISQIIGEFKYMLAEHDLNLVCDEIDTPACISADGNLLWRILDNLMSNICKYAKTGTDVFLDVKITDYTVKMILKNTSQNPITTDGDELLERFVRDDSSRHTEGDGLGLSIAKKLTELQGGKMELKVDEYLFEITLTFNRIYES